MPRKRKATPDVKRTIERHEAYIEWIEEVLRVKRTVPVEDQAKHVREKSEEYWIGLAHGASSMLEAMLHEFGCYAGFQHMSEKRTQRNQDGTVSTWREAVGPDHPEYTSWRVRYFMP